MVQSGLKIDIDVDVLPANSIALAHLAVFSYYLSTEKYFNLVFLRYPYFLHLHRNIKKCIQIDIQLLLLECRTCMYLNVNNFMCIIDLLTS